ncbi:hypothetical protein CEXT_204671 [Caerostris extrusa]|uniref:Uncharacterized protein n=1 Tax=Caerostris extrusa TaxID=172846 RepID=A0AAV4MS16_CAEEX|nr:hypothetical protein CEXT_204671 [Caerostris extrusa]
MHHPISIAQIGHQENLLRSLKVQPRDTENFLYSGNHPASTSSSLRVRRICMARLGPFVSLGMEGWRAIHHPPASRGGMVPNIKEERTESNTIEERGMEEVG